eukprot:snap_masked-scaffold_8-processed-gene-0.5-mRNA-1 protein AED:1.00 eAED:1.00 QI:0/-1/0/0/-1/1/1/0/555
MKLTTGLILAAVLGNNQVSASARGRAHMDRKTEFWETHHSVLKQESSVVGDPQVCTDGSVTAGGITYECDKVNFLSLVSREDMTIERSDFSDGINELADIWGAVLPSGRKIALSCMTNGIWFIDVSDPVNPARLGYIESPRSESYWCDVKVYENTAYIVQDAFRGSETDSLDGVMVFDLLRLEGLDAVNSDIVFEMDYHAREHGATHNVVLNPVTGYLYSVGVENSPCGEGMHIYDLKTNRLEPEFAGCAPDKYVHDAICVIYDGPDSRFLDKEICFGSNEDALDVLDVTDKTNITLISRTSYEPLDYTHQSWLTADMGYLLLNDEGDEYLSLVEHTRTHVVDLSDLTAPVFQTYYEHKGVAIDHNLYIWGAAYKQNQVGSGEMEEEIYSGYAYHTNYVDGLRIWDISDIGREDSEFSEVGFFDTSPDMSGNQDWYGTWSSFMFPDGTIVVNSIENGMFALQFEDVFFTPESEYEIDDPEEYEDGETEGEDDDIEEEVLYGLTGVALLLAIILLLLIAQLNKKSNQQYYELEYKKEGKVDAKAKAVEVKAETQSV